MARASFCCVPHDVHCRQIHRLPDSGRSRSSAPGRWRVLPSSIIATMPTNNLLPAVTGLEQADRKAVWLQSGLLQPVGRAVQLRQISLGAPSEHGSTGGFELQIM